MNTEKVDINTFQGIGTITFSHPQSNSLPSELLTKLTSTITEAGKNEDIKVIVLKSEGTKAFCAGASFNELICIKDFESGKTFFLGFANLINAIRKCPKFVIGRVQGKAVGGGVGLVAATDYCLATTKASVKLSELSIGIGPFVVGPAVERKIGVSAMSQLSINATQWKSPEWALEKGLYAEVYDSIEDLDEAVANLASKLKETSLEAMKELKQSLWEGTQHWDQLLDKRAVISGKLVMSDFTRKAIKDFKRKKD